MDLSIESIRDGDDEQRHDLGRQAFGMTQPFDPEMPGLDPDRVVAAYRDDRLMGTVVTMGFRMGWAGSLVSCGGVSGVVVRPEARGRGVARALMQESYRRMTARDEVIAALYPTTATLYRSLGFEVAGSFEWRRVPLDLVPTEPADVLSWRRVEVDDPAIRRIHDLVADTVDGWIVPDDFWWQRSRRRMVTDSSTNRYAYVGARDGDDVAALVYRYDSSDERLYEIVVEAVVGVDGDSLAAALGFVARNGTTAGHLQTTLPAPVVALHVPNAQQTKVTSDWPWMVRLVDVAGAVAARGWPSTVEGRVQLDVVDPVLPANAGARVLEIHGGAATATPGGSGAVRVSVSDLAAVYAGADVRLLHAAGRLRGATPADLDLLATACVSSPTVPFFF